MSFCSIVQSAQQFSGKLCALRPLPIGKQAQLFWPGVVRGGIGQAFLPRSTAFLLLGLIYIFLCTNLEAVKLEGPTMAAFEAYIMKREAGLEERGKSRNFLWCLEKDARRQAAREKGIAVEPFEGKAMHDAGEGLIHDWVGATFIPKVTLQQVIEFVQNYNRHQDFYKPEVVRSKLVSRQGDFFKVYLRLKKTKVITVVLDTDYNVTYKSLDSHHTVSRSYSTRIAEVANPGQPDERPLPAGEDHGFLWRLYTYWRFAEQEGGVYMECEAISLTRGIPTLLGPIVRPFVKELPLESLERTLKGTRLGLASQHP